jgi:hypothetical protein
MDLRTLLTQLHDKPERWADADHHARRVLGTDVAARIQWSDEPDMNGWHTGQLTDGTDTVYLRHEQEEPGSERLDVRVICPYDPTCPHAYDEVTGPDALLAVLDGQPSGDPWCDQHDAL